MDQGSRRFTRDEARQALVEAGIEILVDLGPSNGLGKVTFSSAIERSGVPRPSAYRVFGGAESSAQELFHVAIIEKVFAETIIGDSDLIEQAIAPVLAEAEAVADSATGAEMTRLLRELVRVFGNVVFDTHAADPFAPIFLAAQVAGLKETPDSPLFTALDAAGARARDDFTEGFRSIAQLFGCRLAEGWTWPGFAAAAGNPITGCLTNQRTPGNVDLELPTGTDDAPERWSTFALCLWSVVRTSWVPNPRLRNPATPNELR